MNSKTFAEVLKEINLKSSRLKDFEQRKEGICSVNQTHFELNQFNFRQSYSTLNKGTFFLKTKKSIPYFKGLLGQRKIKVRAQGPAHQLSDKQKESFSFFKIHSEFLLEDFSIEELKKSFKKLCFKMHPDHSLGTNQDFIKLKTHYENLKLVFNKTSNSTNSD